MRIDSNTYATIGSLQDGSSAQRTGNARVSTGDGDGVTAQLSPDSKTVNSSASQDNVRQDRVAALCKAVESGTYEVNATGVAAAMMDSIASVRFTA